MLMTTVYHVDVPIAKDQVMQAVRAMTVDDEWFDPDPWSIWDAEVFEAAAVLIRREIAMKKELAAARGRKEG
jgi:hypothetical protein